MRVLLTPDDLKRGELAEPGWHPAEISDYTEKAAETDGSTNSIFHFKIIDGPNKGIICQRLFNEKAFGFGKSLWPILFGPPTEKGYDISSDMLKSQIGKKLKIYIKRGKSNKGNDFNDVQDFQPLT